MKRLLGLFAIGTAAPADSKVIALLSDERGEAAGDGTLQGRVWVQIEPFSPVREVISITFGSVRVRGEPPVGLVLELDLDGIVPLDLRDKFRISWGNARHWKRVCEEATLVEITQYPSEFRTKLSFRVKEKPERVVTLFDDDGEIRPRLRYWKLTDE